MLFRVLPPNGHDHPLSEAKKHREVAAVLNNLGPAAFFAGQFAQSGDNRGQQLNDDRRADVRHDTQGSDRAMLQSAAGEHTVHAQQRPTRGVGFAGEVILKDRAIEARDAHDRLQPADRQHHQGEQEPGLKLRDLEAIEEGIVDRSKHGGIRV